MEHMSVHELVAATVDPTAVRAVMAEFSRRMQVADEERLQAEAVARQVAELEQKLAYSKRRVVHLERQMSCSSGSGSSNDSL
jgi:predicted RNase H-like nuclease (RuvC/YqgF family)